MPKRKWPPVRPLRPATMLAGVAKNADDSIIRRKGDTRNVQLPEMRGIAAKMARQGIHVPCEIPGSGLDFEIALKDDAIEDLAIHRRRAGVDLWTVLQDVELGHRRDSLP